MNPCLGSNLNGFPWIQGLKGPKTGSIGPKKRQTKNVFFVFSLFFYIIIKVLKGLNDSKIAN